MESSVLSVQEISVSPAPAPPRLAVHDHDVRFTRRDRVISALAIAAFVAARLVHLGSYRLWYDEIFTLEAAERGWGNLVWFVQHFDQHSPLFYLLVKCWIAMGGESFLWLGSFPAVVGIG